MYYCGCDIQLQSVITVSDEGELPSELDERALAWEALYVPSTPDEKDPIKAPTEVAPSLPDEEQGESPSIPATPYEVNVGIWRGESAVICSVAMSTIMF